LPAQAFALASCLRATGILFDLLHCASLSSLGSGYSAAWVTKATQTVPIHKVPVLNPMLNQSLTASGYYEYLIDSFYDSSFSKEPRAFSHSLNPSSMLISQNYPRQLNPLKWWCSVEAQHTVRISSPLVCFGLFSRLDMKKHCRVANSLLLHLSQNSGFESPVLWDTAGESNLT
jgi:hypothetical protein